MNHLLYRRLFIVNFLVFAGLHMTTTHADTHEHQRPPSIQVSGTGKVMAAPDKADLTLSIEVQAKSAESARKQAAVAMDALIRAVKNQGVDDKDIQTRTVSLYPSYSNDAANKITGYQLTNQVTVIIHDIDKASDIIDSAVSAGGNATRVQGINFSIDNPENAMAEAREKAFANAKNKAGQYAKLAGISLGAPLHITEAGSISSRPMPYAEMQTMKAAMADSASTPVQAGEQEVIINVDVVFGIN